ncbi:hypothetical protein NG708_19155, partial [Acinetobacter baumannii]|nr:hypothetical protein [Acinetobacter baumannii]
YLKASIVNAGLDPENLPDGDPSKMSFGSGGSSKSKAWRDIWGSGQGIGAVNGVESTGEFIGRLKREYAEAQAELAGATRWPKHAAG